MKQNTTRLLALLLCCAMLFSLCACGTTTASAESTTTAEPVETAATETEAPADEVEEASAVSTTYQGTSGSADDYFIPVAESIESFETVTVPCYVGDVENSQEITIGVLNGMNDIPYLGLNTVADLLVDTFATWDSGASADFALDVGPVTDDNTCFALVREDDATMVVDFNSGIITFTDLALFTADPDAANAMDVVSTTTNGGNTLFSHDNGFYRAGAAIIVDLPHYGILPVLNDGEGYLPLQTVADLIFDRVGLLLLWDGQEVMVADSITYPTVEDDEDLLIDEDVEAPDTNPDTEAVSEEQPAEETSEQIAEEEQQQTLSDLYYAAPKQTKSDALTTFTYNELCLALDYNYGLQSEHAITSFNQMFQQSGLIEDLRSSDAGDVYLALSKLCSRYFSDSHSGTNAISYMTEQDPNSDEMINAASPINVGLYLNPFYYSMARMAYYPDGPVGYEEVGDTAYITFDSFYFDSDRDYYNTEITNNANDTFELILYANQQLTRENCPIKNVVIDLSNNGGGYADAAACVLAWMLHGASISLVDPISGAQSTTVYNFDSNLDGNCSGYSDDGLPLIGGFNLFCIISPNSFSCGNLVPCMLEDSNRVTLIGRSSTGGACVVESMSTADGNIFQISGPRRICSVYNGSYYSVDEGVDPDIYISDINHLYDRAYMTNLIDNLP